LAPGVLVTTLGPGLANAVNGIADAAQERTPLLVISGVVERSIRGRYTHQIVDQAALLRPLVKASFEIEMEGCASVVQRAVRLAMTPPCGPVHIDLSPAVAAALADAARIFAYRTVHRPAFDAADARLAALRARIAQAERPLIVAGFEAARAGAAVVIADIADNHAIPMLTTYKAKGLLDERHAASIGAAGLSPKADAILADVVRAADLILLVGYDPIEMRAGWLDAFGAPDRVVALNETNVDHAMHETGDSLHGDVKYLLTALFEGMEVRAHWPCGTPAAVRERLAAAFRPATGWGPHAVFAALEDTLPTGGVVTVDSGAHRILLSQQWQAREPLSLLQSAGWCTMGSAIPLAIGAKLSAPQRAVVAVLGDGGLEMTLGELATLRDQHLPVVVLVLQDESLALIELKQAQAGLAPVGVRLGATRFADIATAFGGHGVEVNDGEALRAALRDAFARPTFSVVVCPVQAAAYVGAI
jgi:acetolactate synthase-1/2/3 large subunit